MDVVYAALVEAKAFTDSLSDMVDGSDGSLQPNDAMIIAYNLEQALVMMDHQA